MDFKWKLSEKSFFMSALECKLFLLASCVGDEDLASSHSRRMIVFITMNISVPGCFIRGNIKCIKAVAVGENRNKNRYLGGLFS